MIHLAFADKTRQAICNRMVSYRLSGFAAWAISCGPSAVLVFVFVEQEVLLGGVVGPNVFDGFVDFAFVFEFLQVFDHFHRSAGTHGVVNQFVFGGGPGCIFQLRGQFQCPSTS